MDAYAPTSVLAYQTGLGLSDEQTKKIQEIADKAREQVKAFLTQDQAAKLKPMTTGPQNWAQMCQWMTQNAPQGGGNWMMMEPMMMSPAATQPAQGPGANAPQQGQNMMGCPMRCW